MNTVNTHAPMKRTLAVIDGGWNVAAGVQSISTAPKPKLIDQVRQAIRTRHYSYRTEKAYVHWIKRYIFFHDRRHPVGIFVAPFQSIIMRPNVLICAGLEARAISIRHFSASRVSGAKRQRTSGHHARMLNTKSGMKQPNRSIHRYDLGRRSGRKQLPRRINPATSRCRAISPASIPPKEMPPTMSGGSM